MSYLKTTDIVTKLRERTDYSTMLLCDPPRPAPDRLCHDAAEAIGLREIMIRAQNWENSFKDHGVADFDDTMVLAPEKIKDNGDTV